MYMYISIIDINKRATAQLLTGSSNYNLHIIYSQSIVSLSRYLCTTNIINVFSKSPIICPFHDPMFHIMKYLIIIIVTSLDCLLVRIVTCSEWLILIFNRSI